MAEAKCYAVKRVRDGKFIGILIKPGGNVLLRWEGKAEAATRMTVTNAYFLWSIMKLADDENGEICVEGRE